MGCCGGGHRSGNHGRSESGHGNGSHRQETNENRSKHAYGNEHSSGQMVDHGHGKRKSKFWSLFSFSNHSNHH